MPVEVKLGRGGLGREKHQQQKKEQNYAKRQRFHAEQKNMFVRRMNEKHVNRNTERDFYKSQKVCEQLDSQSVGN